MYVCTYVCTYNLTYPEDLYQDLCIRPRVKQGTGRYIADVAIFSFNHNICQQYCNIDNRRKTAMCHVKFTTNCAYTSVEIEP